MSLKLATNVKLGLYKSVIPPVLVYGLQCVALTKTELTVLKTAKSSASPYVSTTERFFTAKKTDIRKLGNLSFLRGVEEPTNCLRH